jgi:hypothetical protein
VFLDISVPSFEIFEFQYELHLQNRRLAGISANDPRPIGLTKLTNARRGTLSRLPPRGKIAGVWRLPSRRPSEVLLAWIKCDSLEKGATADEKFSGVIRIP